MAGARKQNVVADIKQLAIACNALVDTPSRPTPSRTRTECSLHTLSRAAQGTPAPFTMSTGEAAEQRRKLALLEARLNADSTTPVTPAPSVSRALPASIGSLSGSAFASSTDSGSSRASIAAAPSPPQSASASAAAPPPTPTSTGAEQGARPRAANARRNYAPLPQRRDSKGSSPAPPAAGAAASGTPSLRARAAAPTPTAPRKRRRTGASAASPSTMRNSRVDSYFKPLSRDSSKDCPRASRARASTSAPTAAAAVLTAVTSDTSKGVPDPVLKRTPSPDNLPVGSLPSQGVKRTLAFVSPASAPTRATLAEAGRLTPPSASSARSVAITPGDDLPHGEGGTFPDPNVSLGNADDYRHLRGMIERLTEENKRLKPFEARVKELEAENEDLSTQLEIEMPMLREQASASAAENEKITAQLKVMQSALRDAVVATAKLQRAEARRKVSAMGERVGRLGLERTRTSLQEVWEEGNEWKDISKKLATIQTEREAIDKKRRDISRTKASLQKSEAARARTSPGDVTDDQASSPAGGSDVVPFSNTSAFVAEQEEIYRVQLQVLKREEQQLVEQRARLTRERDVLVRELRRQSDEDISVFNKFQTVNDRYVALNLLGRGGFSEVYKGFDLQQGRYVACKIHQLASNWSEVKKRTFIRHSMREYEIHKSLRHPRVVQLIDIFEIDENTFCTVLEYCDGSDLDSYLRMHQSLSEREARSIIAQVVSGLVYLSEQHKRIIHYDLKPGNILLHKGEVRIADFGLSKIMNESDGTSHGMELTSQGAGTMWYLPPECFETASQARINTKVDVWSAGVILFQTLYGRKPFGHDQTQEKMFREKTVSHQTLKFPAKPVVSEAAKQFMSACLTRKAADRPSVVELVGHPFLKKR